MCESACLTGWASCQAWPVVRAVCTLIKVPCISALYECWERMRMRGCAPVRVQRRRAPPQLPESRPQAGPSTSGPPSSRPVPPAQAAEERRAALSRGTGWRTAPSGGERRVDVIPLREDPEASLISVSCVPGSTRILLGRRQCAPSLECMSEQHDDVYTSIPRSRSARDETLNPESVQPPPSRGVSTVGKIVRVVIAVALMHACAFLPVLLILIPGIRGLTDGSILGKGTAGIIVAYAVLIIAYGAASALAIVMCRILLRTLDRGRGISLHLRPSARAVAWLVAMTLLAAVVLCATSGVIHLLGVQDDGRELAGNAWAASQWWRTLISGITLGFLLQGIPEEVVWRGWLFASLGSTRAAAVISVMTFTVLHLVSQGGQQGIAERFIYLATPCGFAIAAVATRMVSGSTWAAIGIHGGFHLANNLLGYSLGISEGPVTWVVSGLLWAAVGAVILVIGARTGRLRLGG